MVMACSATLIVCGFLLAVLAITLESFALAATAGLICGIGSTFFALEVARARLDGEVVPR